MDGGKILGLTLIKPQKINVLSKLFVVHLIQTIIQLVGVATLRDRQVFNHIAVGSVLSVWDAFNKRRIFSWPWFLCLILNFPSTYQLLLLAIAKTPNFLLNTFFSTQNSERFSKHVWNLNMKPTVKLIECNLSGCITGSKHCCSENIHITGGAVVFSSSLDGKGKKVGNRW